MSSQIWITADTAQEEGGKQDRWLALVWTPKLCDFCHHDASQALFLHLQGTDIMCLSLPPPETAALGCPLPAGGHSQAPRRKLTGLLGYFES